MVRGIGHREKGGPRGGWMVIAAWAAALVFFWLRLPVLGIIIAMAGGVMFSWQT